MRRGQWGMWAVLSALLLIAVHDTASRASVTCSYFAEDFSGLSAHTWSYSDGTWNDAAGLLEVSDVTAGKMAIAETAFSSPEPFFIDVDIQSVSMTDSIAAYAIYLYTSGDFYLTVDGRTVDGVAAFVFPNLNQALLSAWDVVEGEWHDSASTTPPSVVDSIGLSFTGEGVILRLNRQDTSIRFTGDFSLASTLLDTLWLIAQGNGTRLRFDNVCAAPLGADGIGDYDGIWKDAAATMNFYVQTYTPGSAIIIGTPDAKTFYVFLEPDVSDGVDVLDLAGKGHRLVMDFASDSQASITLSPANAPSKSYSVTKAFGIPGAPSHHGIWKSPSCQSATMNYYVQTYDAGSGIVIVTADLSTIYVFLDSDASDGMDASALAGTGERLCMTFESGGSGETVARCVEAPHGGSGGVVSAFCTLSKPSPGTVILDPPGPDGTVSGALTGLSGGTKVIFTSTPQGEGKATAKYQIEGDAKELLVELTAPDAGTIRWNGVSMDGFGALAGPEQTALSDLASSPLADAVAQVPLELGCNEREIDSASLAALLMPWQMVLKYLTADRAGESVRVAALTPCGYFQPGDETAASGDGSSNQGGVLLLAYDAPIPVVFGFFPFDDVGAAGEAASSFEETGFTESQYGPCAAKCRGACGADCATGNNKACKPIKTEIECLKDETTDEYSGMSQKWVTYECGSHPGCREHDDCFDTCNRTYGCGSWRAGFCRHNTSTNSYISGCDTLASQKWGAINCIKWAQGYEGLEKFDRTDTFVYKEGQPVEDPTCSARSYKGSGAASISVDVSADGEHWGNCSSTGGSASFSTTIEPGKLLVLSVRHSLSWEFGPDGVLCDANSSSMTYGPNPEYLGVAMPDGAIQFNTGYDTNDNYSWSGNCLFDETHFECGISLRLGPTHGTRDWWPYGPDEYDYTSTWTFQFNIPVEATSN
ncbi:MAG: hypothetical protein HY788_21515 [Deltaproteobacteria bacterium]|nr:hypothetical protein [Deltaproteobacteria bacterium]